MAAGAAQIIEVMPMIDPSLGVIHEAEDRTAASTSASDAEYHLVLADAAGNALAAYPIIDDDPLAHGEPPPSTMLFAGALEQPPGATIVRVTRAGAVIAERAASANAPIVTLLSPNGGEQIGDQLEASWEASDADGDALRFTLMYSDDGGTNWAPVATDLRGDRVRIDASQGLAGSERALFRIVASDGMRTAHDDSDASFTIANRAPLPYIVGPADGAEITGGATVVFAGGATDLEDGRITRDALRWRSSRDGDLGSSAEITTRSLSAGDHRITLEATDAAGATAEYAIEITISGTTVAGPPDADEVDAIENAFGIADDDDRTLFVAVVFIVVGLAALAATAGIAYAFARSRRTGP
jgi:hypothetical protein